MRLLPADSVDLIYLDPPFQSGKNYNLLFEEQDGANARAQVRAFEDTWEWDEKAISTYVGVVASGARVGRVLEAFHQILRGSPMLAYLSMMAPRLLEMRRLLKPTGSIYLHCDLTASAHLRILMDAVFGPKNFRNEIIWYYYNKIHDLRKKLFARATDNILLYVKDVESEFTFNQLKEKREKPVKQLVRKKVDGRMVNAKDEQGHVMYRVKDDRTVDNVWRIPCIQPADKTQRLGYPTQKPIALLERIIQASSNEGDVVLDPFCGCGTTIEAAQRLKRNWIGIDIATVAIKIIRERLSSKFPGIAYNWTGEPTDLEGAGVLAKKDPHAFQEWIIRKLEAWPDETRKVKRGGDGGIDGIIRFSDAKKSRKIIVSVKGGTINPDMVRALLGTVQLEKACMGVLVSLNEPTQKMRAAAAEAGSWKSEDLGIKYPKIQLLTVKDLLRGKRALYPAQPVQQNLSLAGTISVIQTATRLKQQKQAEGEDETEGDEDDEDDAADRVPQIKLQTRKRGSK